MERAPSGDLRAGVFQGGLRERAGGAEKGFPPEGRKRGGSSAGEAGTSLLRREAAQNDKGAGRRGWRAPEKSKTGVERLEKSASEPKKGGRSQKDV
jgi:hypothetical protein